MERRGEAKGRPPLQGFGSPRHLAGRFFGAIDPRGPSFLDDAWALHWLLPGERQLWRRVSGPDRRHAIAVAKEVQTMLSRGGTGGPTRTVMASALLHDVGKVESGLGTLARVAVTLLAISLGRKRLTAPLPGGADEGSFRARARLYLLHDEIGADLLRAAGSDGDTVNWAAEHHLDPRSWSLEPRIASALKAADGD